MSSSNYEAKGNYNAGPAYPQSRSKGDNYGNSRKIYDGSLSDDVLAEIFAAYAGSAYGNAMARYGKNVGMTQFKDAYAMFGQKQYKKPSDSLVSGYRGNIGQQQYKKLGEHLMSGYKGNLAGPQSCPNCGFHFSPSAASNIEDIIGSSVYQGGSSKSATSKGYANKK
jgi:hypothetical protein